MTKPLLIILVRNPVPGKVKTRLAATMGEARALEIYLRLLAHTAEITKTLPVDKVVYYSDFIDKKDIWDHTVYQKQLQHPGDLGQKLKRAFEWGFDAGYRDICIIGSDCFELTPEIIMDGFQALATYNAVLGPARDGGYYLLGLKKMYARIFEGKQWGTDTVASETLTDFKSHGLKYCLLQPLNDVDVEDDLGM